MNLMNCLLSLDIFSTELLDMDIHLEFSLILWKEVGLELREDIDTVLKENMVISMEPMIMIPGIQELADIENMIY